MIYTVGPQELVFDDEHNKLKLLEEVEEENEEPRRWEPKDEGILNCQGMMYNQGEGITWKKI
jgi:hypothetical protein